MYFHPSIRIVGDELTRERALNVELSSVGNPDYQQDPDRALPGVPSLTVKALSLLDASRHVRAYIDKYQLGVGSWSGGTVRDFQGRLVAHITYNGAVWRELARLPAHDELI